MTKEMIKSIITNHLSTQFFCTKEDLEQNETVFTINTTANAPYIKMMAYRNCVIVCSSQDMYKLVRSELNEKNRDEIFEFPFVYGQTIHYVPNLEKMYVPELPAKYTYELLEKKELCKLIDVQGIDNAVEFDEEGKVSAEIAFVAKKNEQIIGIAGAGIESDKIWEVGVDVKPEFRNSGLGTKLVIALANEILNKGVVPFYSASVTNIGSQMIAARSNFEPCWIDSFGNIFDEYYAYKKYADKYAL